MKSSSVFIGARKAGLRVIVTREITRRSGAKALVTIRSITKKLPKKAVGTKQTYWMQDPKLGDVLTSAFRKAVKAAKKKSELSA